MKLLTKPKAEVTLTSLNPDIGEKIFTYTLGENYPSEEMICFRKMLSKDMEENKFYWTESTKIFPPTFELSKKEYFYYRDKKNNFLRIVKDPTSIPFPKDDIELDGFLFKGCFLEKETIPLNDVYICKFNVDRIILINDIKI